jgi:hypothetical protein
VRGRGGRACEYVCVLEATVASSANTLRSANKVTSICASQKRGAPQRGERGERRVVARCCCSSMMMMAACSLRTTARRATLAPHPNSPPNPTQQRDNLEEVVCGLVMSSGVHRVNETNPRQGWSLPFSFFFFYFTLPFSFPQAGLTTARRCGDRLLSACPKRQAYCDCDAF